MKQKYILSAGVIVLTICLSLVVGAVSDVGLVSDSTSDNKQESKTSSFHVEGEVVRGNGPLTDCKDNTPPCDDGW